MKIYPSHIPTTTWEKALLAIGSGLKGLQDPLRAGTLLIPSILFIPFRFSHRFKLIDMVAAFGETTGACALQKMRYAMLSDPTGRRILKERPVITSDTLSPQSLTTLSKSTLGGAYYHDFMKKHAYIPESRSPVHFIDQEELAYVMLRYRQVHDLWHALTGLPPTVLGELGLKTFEFVQTRLPMTLLGSIFGPVQLSPQERHIYFRHLVPWAIRTGTSSKNLMNVYYEEILDRELIEVRESLRIQSAPRWSDSDVPL
jgi:ubiquinone biosynthesis protein COQ4